MRRQFPSGLLGASLIVLLASCGQRSPGENAQDYANKVGGPAAAPASGSRATSLPQAAANGRKTVTFATPYTQVDASTGVKRGLTLNQDGTFDLLENGQATHGTYTWLPDGKRLRLNGVANRPIVLIANGAIYRLTNENVPIDDLTQDRMYQPAR